jgi:hypothetical protein
MDQVTVITPVGCIGNRGVDKDALIRAIDKTQPHVLAMDAGSMDCGPWYLGAGKAHSPTLDILWDLEHVLCQAVPRGISVVIGSAGGSGARAHVDTTVEMIQKVAREKSLHFRLAVIYSDVPKEFLLSRAENGTVAGTHSLDDGSALRVEAVKESNVIVGLMGVEPIIDALEDGADVVLCGRASDSAVIAAYPVWKGFERGLSYHMGDIMECGESAAEELRPTLRALAHNRIPIIGRMEKDCFYLWPAVDTLACTPDSCLMHSFYERTDIRASKVPGGVLDKGDARYTQHDAITTKISGSQFVDEPYSILLEGTKPVGHRYVFIFGVRTLRMIEQLDEILSDVEEIADKRFEAHGAFNIHWHRFGKDAVLQGSEMAANVAPREVGVVADVVAETAELAHDVACDLQTRIAFWRYPGRYTTAGNVAMTLSPASLDGGPVYEFSIYHPIQTDDYREVFRRQIIEV